MALYPFVHVSALELHALSHYPSNRQNETDRQKHQQTTVCLHCACARHKKAYRFFVLATECQDLETVLYDHTYILTNISIPHKAVVDEAVNCHSLCPYNSIYSVEMAFKSDYGFYL